MQKVFSSFRLPLFIAFLIALWFIFFFLIQRDEHGHFIRFLLTDDAMISMDYARSLIQGCGLVWYCGADKVEGFTNPLWVLYMAFWHLWGIPRDIIALPIILTGFITLSFQFVYTRRLFSLYLPPSTTSLASWIIALFPPLTLWHFMGLETGAILTLIAYLSFKAAQSPAPDWKALLATAIGLLLRMDFLIPAFSIGLFWAYRTRKWSSLFSLSLVILLTLTLLTIGRWMYYKALLPNTYQLKVASVPFVLRIANGLATLGGSIGTNMPLWALAAYGAHRLGRRHDLSLLAIVLAGSVCAYTVYVGGDAWESAPLSNRYLAQSYLALTGLAAFALEKWTRWVRIGLLLGISAGISNRWSLLSTISPYVKPLTTSSVSNVFSVFVPFPLEELKLQPTGKIWLGPAGTTPYFYPEYRYGDYLGKCDTAVTRRSPTCYLTMRFYQLYTPGHTRIGIDQLLADSTAQAVFISRRGHPGRVRLSCEARSYLTQLETRFEYVAPYGWIKKELIRKENKS
ncbi:MAG: hypothetical protein RMK19_09230 [Bacteroidia bacterium]|nr:hypothetical protein [Bacteroidia bacterium]